MKKTETKKTNLLLELTKRKIEANQAGTSEGFGKFSYKKPRNTNNSNVGPAWGPRKGN
ncbi:hypothetical protein [Pseudobdellovibrio sp. HCB154]|uniref:hypothetical protein n=1 Tax=Pseudobdellovibrio sp. HCB154 TaxID=3386277 RepID=UPI003916F5A1